MNDRIQDLLDSVKEKSREAGHKIEAVVSIAEKKATVLLETRRINMQIVDLNAKCKGIYRAIGELVYAAHRDPNTDTECVDGLLAALDEYQEEIEELKAKYYTIQRPNACTDCGKALGRDDAFCRFCGGASTEAEKEAAAAAEVMADVVIEVTSDTEEE